MEVERDIAPTIGLGLHCVEGSVVETEDTVSRPRQKRYLVCVYVCVCVGH